MRKILISALLVGAGMSVTMPAQAATLLKGSLAGLDDIHFVSGDASPPSSGDYHPIASNTVYGRTDKGNGEWVVFKGNADLTGNSGNATVKGGSGWSELTINPFDGDLGFTGMNFGIMLNSGTTFTVEIQFFGDVDTQTLTGTGVSGNTAFKLAAEGDEIIKSVTLKGNFKQVKQFDMGLAAAPTQSPVPEPATWMMMITGLGIAGAAMRRRTTKVQFA